MERGVIYEKETGLLRRGLFEVQNEVGVGRREEAYHQALGIWLEGERVPYRSRAPHCLHLGGQVAYTLYPDFVVWDTITMELKALPRSLHDEERVQIFDYLKCRGDRLGLLVNMGLDRVHVERVVYDPPQYELIERWDHWNDKIRGDAREVGASVRDALLAIFHEHSTGYGTEVTGKLIESALNHRRLPFRVAPSVRAEFRSLQVDEAPIDCLVIADRILLVFTALFDSNQFNISRGLSYLRAMHLEWGIAANFGKRALQLTGLHLR
jgi:GxxExxY protein